MTSDAREIDIPEKHHAFLEKHIMGVLTTLRKDGLPSSNPVTYSWNGKCIKISTLKSRIKYTSILSDPRVAFCVWSLQNPLQYLEVRGHASMEDDPDKAFLREQFLQVSGQEPPEDLDPPEAERVVITLHPHQVSSPTLYGGRFEK